MTVVKNKVNKVVSNYMPSGLAMWYKVPSRRSKKAQMLTLKSGKTVLNLTGRQVNSLRKVLNAGKN